jgi:hypothetical protein
MSVEFEFVVAPLPQLILAESLGKGQFWMRSYDGAAKGSEQDGKDQRNSKH